jgi:hypothetical protein
MMGPVWGIKNGSRRRDRTAVVGFEKRSFAPISSALLLWRIAVRISALRAVAEMHRSPEWRADHFHVVLFQRCSLFVVMHPV